MDCVCIVWAAPPQWDEIIFVLSVTVSSEITRPSAAVVPEAQWVKAINWDVYICWHVEKSVSQS